MGKPRRYGFFQGKFSAAVLGGWSSTPEKVGKHFLRCGINVGKLGSLGPGWMLSFQDSHCQPWEFLEWSQFRSFSGIHQKIPTFLRKGICRSFMPRPRPQGYQGHRNTETPSASRSHGGRGVSSEAGAVSCENMISLTQMKFKECRIIYVQKKNQDQEEAVFNRCGYFF